jgi:hypothetical protein
MPLLAACPAFDDSLRAVRLVMRPALRVGLIFRQILSSSKSLGVGLRKLSMSGGFVFRFDGRVTAAQLRIESATAGS